MSISTDPRFVVAEAQWRREALSRTYAAGATPARHHASLVQGVLGWAVLRHHHARPGAPRHA
jgi:hypothetical protein